MLTLLQIYDFEPSRKGISIVVAIRMIGLQKRTSRKLRGVLPKGVALSFSNTIEMNCKSFSLIPPQEVDLC